MPLFRYKAVDPQGKTLEGEMEARDQSAVIERLHDLGHLPIRADEVAATASRGWLSRELFTTHKVSRRDVVILTRELATLLDARLPLDHSLEILIVLTDNKPARRLLEDILERVRGGASLGDALSAEGEVFPRFYVSTVQAGEASGSLELVLNRLAEFMDRSQALRESTRSALIYPVILLVMAGLSVLVLLTVVIPQFTPLFEDARAALPWPTQVIVDLGEAFEAYWWVVAIAIVGIVAVVRRQLAQPASRTRWDALVLRLPLVGDLVAKVEMARFSRTLATLFANGVTLLAALSIAKASIGNAVMVKAIDALSTSAKEGEGLARPLLEGQVFPKLAVHLVGVGEESGRLEEMLFKVADIYDREARQAIDRLLALLVPGLTIGLGLLVAGIIMSILSAILSVYELPF